jgi:hypothetical protein
MSIAFCDGDSDGPQTGSRNLGSRGNMVATVLTSGTP